MPPKKKRVDMDCDTSSSDESSASGSVLSDSEEEGHRRGSRKKRYSSDDEYDPARDNVAEATSYRSTRKRRTHTSSQWQSALKSKLLSQASVIGPPSTGLPSSWAHRPIASLLQSDRRTHMTPGAPHQSTSLAQLGSAAIPHADSLLLPASSSYAVSVDSDIEEVDDCGAAIVPAPVTCAARKSDFEDRLLREISALVAPSITLVMDCESIAEEETCEAPSSKCKGDQDVRQARPEYEHDLKGSVFNDDLMLSCETVEEEEEDCCCCSYSEDLTECQVIAHERRLKAHATFSRIYAARQAAGYRMVDVDLSTTGESLEQFKERLRQEMRAAVQQQRMRAQASHNRSSLLGAQSGHQ